MVLVPVIPSHAIPNRSLSSSQSLSDHAQKYSPDARMDEASGLAEAIFLIIGHGEIITIKKPRPATLFGEGKIAELAQIISDKEIDLAIVDHQLTPVQQRNLEKSLKVKVLDRTGLILEIFGERARTKEGRLQVELAHLEYQKSRLVRSWTHLERQRGGFGFLGGPGETQIEADRRMIRNRIEKITKAIHKIKQTRDLHRKSRKAVPYPVIALVGYTNAGKSTLFNYLTGATVMAKDMLFATLDPTMREVGLPCFGKVILSDTVGFISDLPTSLVAAFRATLEEVLEADILLHVRDISHVDSEAQKLDVLNVLRELGLDVDAENNGIIEVWNKIDLLPTDQKEVRLNEVALHPEQTVAVSAVTGEGTKALLELIEDRLTRFFDEIRLSFAPEDGDLMHWAHENLQILSLESDEENGFTNIVARASKQARGQLLNHMRGRRSVEQGVEANHIP